jgi:hypothetical protein
MEAATLYPGIPVSDVTTMARPAKSISDAIEARDGRRFAKAVGEFNSGQAARRRDIWRQRRPLQLNHPTATGVEKIHRAMPIIGLLPGLWPPLETGALHIILSASRAASDLAPVA